MSRSGRDRREVIVITVALHVSLDVAIQHRASTATAHVMPDAMDIDPFLGGLLAATNLIAHLAVENLRAAAGERTQPRLAQNRERFRDRRFENAPREMAH